MAKRTSNNRKNSGRPKNVPAKAGFTVTKRKYGCGGKIKK